MRWFNVLYFEDAIQACLDAIVLFANPTEKNRAHITIQGPYERRQNIESVAEELVGTEVAVVGVNKFFSDTQNTVYLNCGSEAIRRHWHKPDYPFNPHITLYDGPSREFAQSLVNELKSQKLYFRALIGGVKSLSSVPGQSSFEPLLGLNFEIIRVVTGEHFMTQTIATAEPWQRLMYIQRLFTHLTWQMSETHTVGGVKHSN